MQLSVANLDLPAASLAVALLLVGMEAEAQAETTPTPLALPDRKQTADEIVFDRSCGSPEIALDSAPIPALSLDPKYAAKPPEPPLHARPGTTKMHLLVNEQGWVVRARVAASQGDRRMDAAVLRAVEQWRFKPRYLDAKPVCAWGSYALTVEISDEDASPGPESSANQRDHQ